MNNKPYITQRQFVSMAFLGLLSPLMRTLPHSPTVAAGKASWLCALPAFLGLCVMMAFLWSFQKHLKQDEGMAPMFLRCLGPVVGRIVLCIYGLWFLFYTGFLLRSSGSRMSSTIYTDSSPGIFSTIMLVMCLIAAMGTIRGTARTSVILRAVLIAAMLVVFVLSIPNIKTENIWPVTVYDTVPILEGSLSIINVHGIMVYFTFLSGYVAPTTRRFSTPIRWLAVGALMSAAICATVVGTFGPSLTAQMSFPFFVMIRDVTVLGLSTRIEAILIAMWVFADFVLCTAMLRCAHEVFRTVFSLPSPEGHPFFCMKYGRWLFPVMAVVVWILQATVAPTTFQLEYWSRELIPMISAGFVFVGFPLTWVVGKIRRQL